MKPLVYRSPSKRAWLWSCECSPGIVRLELSQPAAFAGAQQHARSFKHLFLVQFLDRERQAGELDEPAC